MIILPSYNLLNFDRSIFIFFLLPLGFFKQVVIVHHKFHRLLIFSNADTGGGDRKRMTVWASFDGGLTWPVKRLVYESFSAYFPDSIRARI